MTDGPPKRPSGVIRAIGGGASETLIGGEQLVEIARGVLRERIELGAIRVTTVPTPAPEDNEREVDHIARLIVTRVRQRA